MIWLNVHFPNEVGKKKGFARFLIMGLQFSADATVGLLEVSSKGLSER